jgi:hypothetical protein
MLNSQLIGIMSSLDDGRNSISGYLAIPVVPAV